MAKVLTAPLAVIRMYGIPIGKMMNVSFDENVNRSTVRGIGNLTPDEVPAVTWDGTMTCSLYTIDFSLAMNVLQDGRGAIHRIVNTLDEFVDTILLQEEGLQVDVMRKKKAAQDPTTGVIQSELEIFLSVRGCFQTREGINVNEGQISQRNASFMYTDPVTYPI